MKDKQAREAIKSLRDAVEKFGERVGIDISYWPDSTYWIRRKEWLLQERREFRKCQRELEGCIEKFDALVDALGFEFERRPAKLIAKKKPKK